MFYCFYCRSLVKIACVYDYHTCVFYCLYCLSLLETAGAVVETSHDQPYRFIDFIVARWLKLVACMIFNHAFSLSLAGLGFIAVKVECICWLRCLWFIDFIVAMFYCFLLFILSFLLSLLPFIVFYCFFIVSYCLLLFFIQN